MKALSGTASLAILCGALLTSTSASALDSAMIQLAQADGEKGGGGPAPKDDGGPKGGGEPKGGPDGGPDGPPAKKKAEPAAKGDDDGPPAKKAPKADDGDSPPPKREKDKDDDGPPAKKAPVPAGEKGGDDDRPKAKDKLEPAQKFDKDDGPKDKADGPKDKAEPKFKDDLKDKAEPKAKVEDFKDKAEPKAKDDLKDNAEPKVKDDLKDKAEPKAKDDKGPPPLPKDAKEGPEPKAKEPPKAAEPAPLPKDAPGAKDDGPKGDKADGSKADKAAPAQAQPEVKDLKEVKEKSVERVEDGGKRVIIEQPDKRVLVKEGNTTIIRSDETERFRRLGRNTRRERRGDIDISISIGGDGLEIYTELDREGRPLRRYRRDRGGREIVLFDNRDYYRRRGDGGSFLDARISLPLPTISVPRDEYIVDYEEASDEDVYEALEADPVAELDRGYSLEEVRRSPDLRDRMRRVDLDSINFAFGSWTVENSQYPALERIARAMNRIIKNNPAEVFLIEGHTDAVGSDDDNLSLSDRRAEAVALILSEEFQVPPENLTTQGYGEQYLKVDTQAAEQANRRVAVRRITPLLSKN